MVVILKPPYLVVKLGFVKQDEYFLVERAMYRLRQSRRSWCVYRDAELDKMVTEEGRTLDVGR